MPALTMEEFWDQAALSRKMIEGYAKRAFRLTPEGAEDLASDAIAQAAHYEQKEGSPGFSGNVKLSTYLIKVASNIYFNRNRKRESKSIVHSLDEDDSPAHEMAVAPQQHELAMASSAGKRLRAAIATLPTPRRATLECLLDGYTPDEATEVLNVKMVTFKSNKSRALADLRKHHPELRQQLPGSKYTIPKTMHEQARL